MKKLAVSLFIVLCSIYAVAAQSEKQKNAIRAEITKVMTDQAAAWNRGDIDGFMQGY
jgi:hypothetical protein